MPKYRIGGFWIPIVKKESKTEMEWTFVQNKVKGGQQ